MKCARCGISIKEGEEKDYKGEILCEDCYIDMLSPARTCDPWAVYTARSSMEKGTNDLTDIQVNILNILKETGGETMEALAKRMGMKLTDLEREIATLRHMEKVKAQLRDGKKIICLW